MLKIWEWVSHEFAGVKNGHRVKNKVKLTVYQNYSDMMYTLLINCVRQKLNCFVLKRDLTTELCMHLKRFSSH